MLTRPLLLFLFVLDRRLKSRSRSECSVVARRGAGAQRARGLLGKRGSGRGSASGRHGSCSSTDHTRGASGACHSLGSHRGQQIARELGRIDASLQALDALGQSLERELAFCPAQARERDLEAQTHVDAVAQLCDQVAAGRKCAAKSLGASKSSRLVLVAGNFFCRAGNHAVDAAGKRRSVEVANMIGHIGCDLNQVLTGHNHAIEPQEGIGGVARCNVAAQLEERARIRLAQLRLRCGQGDGAATGYSHLLKRGGSVAHAALRLCGDKLERLFIGVKALRLADARQIAADLVDRKPAEVKALAARLDGLGHLVRIGRAHDEDNVRRGLFQGLEQRVERRVGEHVDLVDDVDLVAAARRGKLHARDDLFAHVFYAGAARSVELVDVGVRSVGDLLALRAAAIGCGRGAALAQERLGQQASAGGLSRAARPAKQIRVSDVSAGHGVGQGVFYMLLTHDVCKRVGAVFAVEGNRHRRSLGRKGSRSTRLHSAALKAARTLCKAYLPMITVHSKAMAKRAQRQPGRQKTGAAQLRSPGLASSFSYGRSLQRASPCKRASFLRLLLPRPAKRC